jgi:ribosomal protein S18 acetylase RimI-like enzyme
MSLEFRNATEQDIPIIAQLADRIWRKHYIPLIGLTQVDYMLGKMYSPASIAQQMREKQHYTLVYQDQTPIGYISISTKDNKHYFLHKFYIDASEQGKGIGSQLFEHVLGMMKTAKTIELTVNRENYKSINFYFKHGFIIKEVLDLDIGNGFFMNDFVMLRSPKL